MATTNDAFLDSLYSHASRGLLVRGKVSRDERGDPTCDIQIYMTWTFATSGSDKIISVQGVFGARNDGGVFKEAIGVMGSGLCNEVLEFRAGDTQSSRKTFADYVASWPEQLRVDSASVFVDYGILILPARHIEGRLVSASRLNIFVPLLVILEKLRTWNVENSEVPSDARFQLIARLSKMVFAAYTDLRKTIDVL